MSPAGGTSSIFKSLSKDLAERLPEASRGDPKARAAYDAAFEQYADLRQEALLANPLLAFDKLLLIKRFTGYAVADFHNCNEPGQPLNWQANCSMPSHGYDNEIAVLSPVRPDGRDEHAPPAGGYGVRWRRGPRLGR